MALEIRDLNKSFGGVPALERINLTIEASEFVCLLGPSGCGKTTLLRIIAGLLGADRGRILLDGRDLSAVPTRERGFGIVFQSYSLFPNLTVAQNVGYGLSIRRTPKAQVEARVAELLSTVKLSEFAGRYPGELSGGQQQRVAIARALAVNPALLLLDEPLSALDARVRAALREELREVQRSLGIPTLMVTHDQEEAMVLADKVVCMNHGRIEQVGSPEVLYQQPKTRFVAEFMGQSNLLPRDWLQQVEPALAATAPTELGEAALACVRPEALTVTAATDGHARVLDQLFLGNFKRLRLDWLGRTLLAEVPAHTPLRPGDAARVAIAPHACAWIAP
ncbi:MAG: ABC transporter ATP-binding protein [Betaproteobacteria bacterium HGW-Betaproteobacteria-13]|jgi:iron(III) transport system ATP-binding protein|uniref:ABC transporter ATP-binding protein n=1 Tax=Parazoarcus communis TaxID=41977 RepID=A0A2U8H0P0_9RHOO|nr:ATP-binding cassette domain-containing protein [Parazoarcus communis]AWI78746.1 ABC transporter ATP-binding protein [Parazoarcus communis]PKO58813.1 MAG: ABC transporter ATP-binding protein [Betaproteobacteria bacterium HGW-Betaproteobacteria-19]PKO81117.1 MAG: ABC transporter ATP-binding protein [Betaproteobacteria bacterium HGW-Betaproteobacteria-13]